MNRDTPSQAEERGILQGRVAVLSGYQRSYLLGRLVAAVPVPELRECLDAAERKVPVGFGQS